MTRAGETNREGEAPPPARGSPAPGQGEAVSGFGLRASDQAGGTPTPGSSPGQALKPEARSLKPEAWSLKPETAPAVAFVEFVKVRAGRMEDYFQEILTALLLGDLRRAGVRADCFRVSFEEGTEGRAATDELLRRLGAGGYRLAAFEKLREPRLLDRFAALEGLDCVALESFTYAGDPRVKYVVTAAPRTVFGELLARLAAGEEAPCLAGLQTRREGRLIARPVRTGGNAADLALPFDPCFDHVALGAPAAPRTRMTIIPVTGCPYGRPAEESPFFAGVALPEGTAAAGCTFCPLGGDYAGGSPAEVAARVVEQVATLQARLPELAEVILEDQSCTRYLARFFAAAAAARLAPRRLLVSFRADEGLNRAHEWRTRILPAARAAGWTVVPYLVGFESFSADDLRRFNKSVTPAQNAAAFRLLRRLTREFPDACRLDGYRTSSFILFTPWTAPADLQANVDAYAELGLSSLVSGMAHTELRLAPHLPLYHRARADGLLDLDRLLEGDEVSRRFGFSAHVPWRFADSRSAAVHRAFQALVGWVREEQEMGLLANLLRTARHAPAVLDDLDDLTDGMAQLWAAWTGAADCGVPSVPVPATSPAAARASTAFTDVAASFTTRTPRAQRSDFKASASSATAADAAGGRGEPQGAASGVGLQASDQARATLKPEVWSLKPGVTPHSALRSPLSVAPVELAVGRACNNGCPDCLWAGDYRPESSAVARAVLDAAALGPHVTLAGREPTMMETLPEVLGALAARGVERITLVTNGRRLRYRPYLERLIAGGVRAVRVRFFGPDAATHDAHTRVPGSFDEARAGLDQALALLPAGAVGVDAVLTPRSWAALADFEVLAAPAAYLRYLLPAAQVPLDALAALAARVGALRARPPGAVPVEWDRARSFAGDGERRFAPLLPDARASQLSTQQTTADERRPGRR